ncbi:MAG: putative tricarboxylic transport rane protein [Clostridia bacterium]|nr:putative tricarboxylic transport rane protein [Clostridia bacterium]
MRNQRKAFLVVLALVMALLLGFTLAGCGGGKQETPAKDQKQSEVPEEQKEKFPTKPVTLIIPYKAGGGSDVAARLLAQVSEKHLGQSIVPVNVEGGASATGLTQLATSKNDGYTIATCTSTISALKPQGRMPYSSQDYEPVIGYQANTYAIGVNKNSPFKTIEEFIDYAKKNPGKLSVGVSSVGSNIYLSAVAFQMETDTKLNLVPDPGGAAKGILEVAGGNLDAAIGGPNEFFSQIQAGNVRLLAVMTDKRLKAFPDVPTFKEKGINLEFRTCRFILAPKGTPEDRIKILHDAFKKGMEDPKFQEYIKSSGSEEFYHDYKSAKEYLKWQDDYYYKLLERANLLKKK